MGHLQSTMRKIEADQATEDAAKAEQEAAALEGAQWGDEPQQVSLIQHDTNPLAEALQDVAEGLAPVLDLPAMASWVIYRCRPGEGRRARQEFPGLVLSHSNRGPGTLDILVVYDAMDITFLEGVPQRSEDQDNACWRLPEGRDYGRDISGLYTAINQLMQENDAMVPLLQGYAARLDALEADVKVLRKGKKG